MIIGPKYRYQFGHNITFYEDPLIKIYSRCFLYLPLHELCSPVYDLCLACAQYLSVPRDGLVNTKGITSNLPSFVLRVYVSGEMPHPQGWGCNTQPKHWAGEGRAKACRLKVGFTTHGPNPQEVTVEKDLFVSHLC